MFAIAVSGPFGAVKEQSSGLYAQDMASNGFVALAFDPSFTGESGGTTSSTSVETIQKTIQDYLNQIPNSKISYQIISPDNPTYENQPREFTIIMTTLNNQFIIDSFKNKGFTDTVNTTDSKITFTIEITPNNFLWNNVIM